LKNYTFYFNIIIFTFLKHLKIIQMKKKILILLGGGNFYFVIFPELHQRQIKSCIDTSRDGFKIC